MLAITPFLADRFPVFTMVASASLTKRFVAWLAQLWQSFTEWAAQPRQSYRPGYLPTYFQARVYPLWERGLLELTEVFCRRRRRGPGLAHHLLRRMHHHPGTGVWPRGRRRWYAVVSPDTKAVFLHCYDTNRHADHGPDPGSLAAGFQAYMYGGFTPAGGIFATLTSMAMLGLLMPAVLVLARVLATGVAIIVWVNGVGR